MKQPVPIFSADIVDKKLKLFDHEKKAIARWISTFKNGTKIDIVIRRHTKKRTNDQNAYWWAVVVKILSEHTGFEMEEMHAWLKLEFLPVYSTDGTMKSGRSTTSLNTVEFNDLKERVQRWASQTLHVYIPDPLEVEDVS